MAHPVGSDIPSPWGQQKGKRVIWYVLAIDIPVLAALAWNSRSLRKVLMYARADAMDEARVFLRSNDARHVIAKVARSVAKDYIQEQAESRGEPYIR